MKWKQTQREPSKQQQNPANDNKTKLNQAHNQVQTTTTKILFLLHLMK